MPLHYQTIKSLIYQPPSVVFIFVLKAWSLDFSIFFYESVIFIVSSEPLPSGFSPSSSSSSSSTPLAPPVREPSFSFASGSLHAHSDLQSFGHVRTILFLVVEGQQSPPSHRQCLLLLMESHSPSAISAFLQPGIHCNLAGSGCHSSFWVWVHVMITRHLSSFPCKMNNPKKSNFLMEYSVDKASLPYNVTYQSGSCLNVRYNEVKSGSCSPNFDISLVSRRRISCSTEMVKNSFVAFANNKIHLNKQRWN